MGESVHFRPRRRVRIAPATDTAQSRRRTRTTAAPRTVQVPARRSVERYPSAGRHPSGLDEATADRVPGKVHPVAHAQLLEDVRAVPLDGLLADHKGLGNLLAGVTLG